MDDPHQTKRPAISNAFPYALATATTLVSSVLALARFQVCDLTARFVYLTAGVVSGLITLKPGVDTIRLLPILMGLDSSRPSGQDPVKAGAQMVTLYVITGILLLELHVANANYADKFCQVGLHGALS